ncbi:probable G-protein coupled receptor 139 [Hemiscyllium ocellatum]|uniref:probable G-protein coupled receptor 139 n=1 Tax=Hemiscyllium ocellatum TaxID=170820 RepID=UPI002966FF99|nr:probable G-protein coupled receptor 139 [Hemiscyllium ocellatum]
MHAPVIAPFFLVSYSILAAIGAPANLLAIIILSRGRCNLSRCITFYLVAIAVTDFFVIMTAVILNRISRIYFRESILSTTPVCTLSVVLVYATRDCSVWLTVAFTIDRFVAICCQKLKTRYCTEKTASLVIGIVCALCCVKNIPFYFIYEPLYILDGISWFCNVKSNFYVWPAWQAYDWFFQIYTPFLPFFVILMLNVLTIRQIMVANRARRRLRGAEKQQDQEMAHRKRSIILLFTVSLSFLLLWAPLVGHFIYVRLKTESYFGGLDFSDPQYIFQEMTNTLQLFSSCNNVFIYAISQNLFRKELMSFLMYPFATLTNSFKRRVE